MWTWLSDDDDDDGGDENRLSDDDPESDDNVVTHTVTFKCIGANKDQNYQIALQRASDIIANGCTEDVPVRLTKEPNNPKDSMQLCGVYPGGTVSLRRRSITSVSDFPASFQEKIFHKVSSLTAGFETLAIKVPSLFTKINYSK